MKKSIHERVDQLETLLPQLVRAIEQNLMSRLTPTIDSLVDLMGRDKVSEHIVNKNKELLTKDMEEKKALLEKNLVEGKVRPAESVTRRSVIVGVERLADGTEKFPGRFQFAFKEINENFQKELLGKTKGFILDIQPTNEKFEITEIFEIVESE